MISPFKCRIQQQQLCVIVLSNLKTNKTHDLFRIYLMASGSEDICPVKILYKYVQTFGHKSDPLFQFMGGKAVTYAFVAKHLQNIISFIGLNPALYKGHSLKQGQSVMRYNQAVLKTAFKRWADGNQMQFADTFGCHALYFNSTL